MLKAFGRGPARIAPNLTPMVDMVFLLIVFFVLVAQINTVERFELTLPNVAEAESNPIGPEGRLVINVVPRGRAAAMRGEYRLGSTMYAGDEEGLALLVEALQVARSRAPDLEALIRASRDEAYERVHPALDACARAGIGRVQLVTDPTARRAGL